MSFPADAPADWARVYVRGWFTDIGREVRGEGMLGVPGRLTFRLAPNTVSYQADPTSPVEVIDTRATFGVDVNPTTGEATMLVPVGDDPKITPTGFTTLITDPIRGAYDVLISKDTPILDRVTGYGPDGTDPDPLHGERVLELGNIAYDPINRGYYARLPGPPGPPDLHAATHAPGGSDSIEAFYLGADLRGAANGLATLGADGKLTAGQVPSIAVSDFLGSVSSQTAMLALSGQRGDWCIRTDSPAGTWMLVADDPTSLSSWQRLETPTDAVLSVNGQTGVVSLSPQSIGAVPTTAEGIANGVASLDGSSKLPLAQLPAHSHSMADLPLANLDARFDQYYAKGLVRRGRRTTTNASQQITTTNAASATKLIQLDVPVTVGRAYRVIGACPFYSVGASGIAAVQITYTTDGTTPSPGSTRLSYATRETPKEGVGVEATTEDSLVAASTGTIKFLMSMYAATAGTYTPQGTTDWAIRMRVEDVGLDPGTTGATVF